MTNENDRCDNFDLNEHNVYIGCEVLRLSLLHGNQIDICHVHGGKFTPAPQASQPVCEHNHTVRHTYAHIPQGYMAAKSKLGLWLYIALFLAILAVAVLNMPVPKEVTG